MNYALIEPNKLHEELCELLVDKNLKMANLDDKESIEYQVEMYFKKCYYIKYSEGFDNPDLMFDDICRVLKEKYKEDINTILLYSTDEYVYEMVYFEYSNKKEHDEDEFNQFASMSNIELIPIYHRCAVMKTNIKTGIQCTSINYKDLAHITLRNFYHSGVMIEPSKKMTTVTYVSENPFMSIGNTFTQGMDTVINNFPLIIYEEKNDQKEVNEIASSLFHQEIKGRIFLALLAPIHYKKLWDLNENTLNLIIKSIGNADIERELGDNRTVNPFVIMNRHI